MKKLLFAFLLSISLVCPSQASNIRASIPTLTAEVNDTSNATVTVLSAVTGTQYTVWGWVISAATADSVYMSCGTTQISPLFYVAANSNLVDQFYPNYIQCPVSAAVTFTKTTSADHYSFFVFYSSDNQ
jgi:hypothetical protein